VQATSLSTALQVSLLQRSESRQCCVVNWQRGLDWRLTGSDNLWKECVDVDGRRGLLDGDRQHLAVNGSQFFAVATRLPHHAQDLLADREPKEHQAEGHQESQVVKLHEEDWSCSLRCLPDCLCKCTHLSVYSKQDS